MLDITELGNTSTVVTELKTRANAAGIRLDIVPRDRSILHRVLNQNTTSVIFIDYDLWSQNSVGVRALQPPPCVTDTACTDALDSTIAVQVSDLDYFRHYAPIIDHTIRKWKPNATQLRQLLDFEAETKSTVNDTVEVACAWVLNNSKQIEEWVNVTDIRIPQITKLFCKDEPDFKEYTYISNVVKREKVTPEKNITNIEWVIKIINCSDANAIGNAIENRSRHLDYLFLAGVIAMGGHGALASENGAEKARHFQTQLALFGLPSAATRLAPATTAATGRHNSLALALRRFLALQNWKRIALISETTVLAKDFSNALLADGELVNMEEKLESLNHSNVRNALQKLIAVDARVFVVNTGAHGAGLIACVAHSLQITGSNHVWIVREWDPRYWEKYCEAKKMRVFSLSYAWRGSAGLTSQQNETKILGERRAELRAIFDERYKDRAWPLYASAFADAQLALVYALSTALEHNPSLLYNLHDAYTARSVVNVRNTTINFFWL